MADRLTLDVYDTDADAFDATAERAVRLLREGGDRRLSVALSGGRGGRGTMLALAARNDLPWQQVDWWFVDERCVPFDDQHSNVRLARENLLAPRRIPAERVHLPPIVPDDAARSAAGYAAALESALGGRSPVIDLVLLGLGPDGHVASLPPGVTALRATTSVAPVGAAEMNTQPAVDRITMTPPVLTAARHVILTACGKEKAAAVAAALKEPIDVLKRPAQLVPPVGRVAWILDLGAADALIHEAVPAP